MLEHQPGAVLGLTQSGIIFRMGPTSPKQPKPQKMKKTTRGGQTRKKKKKKKKTRGFDGRKTVSGRESMQPQGEGRSVEMSMEVDLVKLGVKRRIRSPLHELENSEGNGKRARMEGEVREFGKLLAHHLGSAEAFNQPRQAQ